VEAPLFLTRDQILGFHAEQLRLFGGQSGLADAGLLESAQIVAPVDSLHAAMIRLTTSDWTKAEFANFLRAHAGAEQ